MDRNPHENRLLNQLDRRRPPWTPQPRSQRATTDPRHLVPRKETAPATDLWTPKETATAVGAAKPVTADGQHGVTTLTARSLRVTLVLQAAEVLAFHCPESARVRLSIRLPDRTVTVDLAAKSLRKAQATIREHGTEAVACVIQGKLGSGDVVLEAGLVAQVKAAKPVAVAA